jgi:hypothetical protein
MLRFVTWDLCDYANPAARDHKREQAIREQLDTMDAGVYAVQGIMGNTPHERQVAFVALTAELGLSCTVHQEDGVPVVAFDPGRDEHGMGLMWLPSIVEPVRGSARIYNHSSLTVGMVMARFEIERAMFTFASAKLPPNRPHERVDDCGYIAQEVVNAGPLGIVGAAWRNVFASKARNGDHYDKDPYRGLEWRPGLWGGARRIAKRPVARREAMEAVEECGLVDPAAWTGAPHFRTTGHWDDDAINARLDGPYVTVDVAAAVEDIAAFDTPATAAPKIDGGLSDRLPVKLVVDVARAQAASRAA